MVRCVYAFESVRVFLILLEKCGVELEFAFAQVYLYDFVGGVLFVELYEIVQVGLDFICFSDFIILVRFGLSLPAGLFFF